MLRYLTPPQTSVAIRLFRHGCDTMKIAEHLRGEFRDRSINEAMVYNSLHRARDNREAA